MEMMTIRRTPLEKELNETLLKNKRIKLKILSFFFHLYYY